MAFDDMHFSFGVLFYYFIGYISISTMVLVGIKTTLHNDTTIFVRVAG